MGPYRAANFGSLTGVRFINGVWIIIKPIIKKMSDHDYLT